MPNDPSPTLLLHLLGQLGLVAPFRRVRKETCVPRRASGGRTTELATEEARLVDEVDEGGEAVLVCVSCGQTALYTLDQREAQRNTGCVESK
jgi:hypothetical protein